MTQSKSSHVDRVVGELRRAIIAHEFAPGDRLAAESLAGRFDVSPTPLREAFARLAGEGFVTYEAQRGVRVAPLSLTEMEEIYELRGMLEPVAIERSIAAADDGWVDELAQRYERMLALGGGNVMQLDAVDYDAYEDAHVAFHRSTLDRCGSAWMLRITDTLTDHSRRFRQISIPLRTRFGSIAAEHEEIFDACCALDGERAAVAHLRHMQNTRDAIRSSASLVSDS